MASKGKTQVDLADFEKVLAKITNPGERAFYGLCRLAGLRRSEAVGLPWSGRSTDRDGLEHWIGVDFKRQRLCLVAPKTETYREVPIAPRLAELLAEADKTRSVVGGLRIEDGVSVSGLSGNNLDRRAGVYCKAAGVEKWPYFFQAMRTSCENDWKAAGIPEPTYTAWVGHSATVSRRHYVSPTDEEFARVTKVA